MSPRSLLRLIAGLILALPAPLALAQEIRPSEPQEMLLGLILDGREALVVDGYWDGSEFVLPAAAFFEVCRCRHEPASDGGVRVTTTLGSATLPASAFVERDQVRMIRERPLDAHLAIRLVYVPTRYALVVDLPWRMERGGAPGSDEMLEPDVRPPAASLSSALFRLQHVRSDTSVGSSASLTVGGRAAGGTWRARYDDPFAGGGPSVAEYGWLRRFDDKLLLLGHQRVNLHPLLGSLELTGAQAAWTNQPLDLFVTSPGHSELLPRQLRSTATIQGHGLPAGTAVLRIDDVAIAAQVMGLDGRYEFREVSLPTSVSQRIEVLVYDRHDPTVPVDIHDHSRGAGRNLLPAGALVMQGGVGREGNLASPFDVGSERAGFYQARAGVTSGMTVEASYQGAGADHRFALGATGQIGRSLVATMGIARRNGGGAFLGDLAGQFGRWRLRARSQFRGAGFDRFAAPARENHRVELSQRAAGGTVEIGVVAQRRRGFGQDRDFVLPWGYWRPDARLLVRARPDSDGRYRVDASWAPRRDWRLGVSRAGEHTVADLSWRLGNRLRTSLVGERTDSGAHRQAALVTWTGTGNSSPSISAGPLLSNGSAGVLVSAQAAPLPGLLAGIRFESSSVLDRPDRARDRRLTLVLAGNLSFAGTRVLPGAHAVGAARAGSLGGKIRLADGYEVPSTALEGVTIRVDGRAVTRTGRGGRFRVAGLDPGVYRLELEPGKLPVELTPRGKGLVVEVAAGAVTRADLWLDVEFGIAGRVTIAGRRLAGLGVELLAADGTVVARGTTDRFGLYRLDAVRPGTYRLRLAGDSSAGSDAYRTVHLVDDFLFDQDLELESAPQGLRPPGNEPR